jgi:hypothetical protein
VHKSFSPLFRPTTPDAYKDISRQNLGNGFRSTRLPSIARENGQGAEVPDGILFPILSAFSAFLDRSGNKWEITIPDVFDENEPIEAAAQAYIEIAGRNPQTMGKSKPCYSTLLRLTSVYARLARAA